jgi:hypothetical protein
MAKRNNALTDRLSRDREITITVTGKRSGRTISLPIWFVLDDGKLYLLPVKGSDTKWYKNVLKDPSIRIDAGGAQSQLKVFAVTDARQVKSVGREIPRQVWDQRRESLFEARRCSYRPDALIVRHHASEVRFEETIDVLQARLAVLILESAQSSNR